MKLTRREEQVRQLTAQGMSAKQIACELGIAVGTIKIYRSRLKLKRFHEAADEAEPTSAPPPPPGYFA